MTRKITQIFIALTILLSLSSCRDTRQKIQAFVNSYNNTAANFSNEIITSTKAKALLQENKIEISMETNIEQNEDNKSLYGQLFPVLLKEMFATDKDIKDLIDEGVIFQVDFLADDNSAIAEFKIDKKELDDLMKKNVGKPTFSTESLGSGTNSEFKQLLIMMNRNLPLKNNDGSKILKVYINDENQLVYQVEMPEDVIEILKNKAASSLIKESILREGQVQKVAGTIQKYGIKDVKYEYLDSKGKIVSNLVLTEKDLKL